MTRARPPIRELAERWSSGTRVRLLWRQGTTVLWVELSSLVRDQSLAILVPPAQALDAFHHPYAYASRSNRLLRAEPAGSQRGLRAIGEELSGN